jgi:hypothetical protein
MWLDAFSGERGQALFCIGVEIGPRLRKHWSRGSDAVFNAE